jgi:CelD/BcsL family acetyltransferase involved in cellulose biosynthesis
MQTTRSAASGSNEWAAVAEGMIVRIDPPGDWHALGARWQALEQACAPNFFLGWQFLGCEAARRFAGALLLSVVQEGQDVALALLGRRGRDACLSETGNPTFDAVFIEHNGLLVRPGHEAAVGPALREVLRRFPALTLSGVGDAMLAAAQGVGAVDIHVSRFAPAVDLSSLSGRRFLDTLSASARAQIRRAMRLYAEPPAIARAQSAEEALDWFASLAALHQASWNRRGRPGAFADPVLTGFHKTLIAQAVPAGKADVLRIGAGGDTLGYLYCFIAGTRVLSYQSGFAHAAHPHAKPGLVCHALAVDFYAGAGMDCYDLLGGADRYKLTLAKGGEMLHWVTLYRRASLRAGCSFLKKRTKKLLDLGLRRAERGVIR